MKPARGGPDRNDIPGKFSVFRLLLLFLPIQLNNNFNTIAMAKSLNILLIEDDVDDSDLLIDALNFP